MIALAIPWTPLLAAETQTPRGTLVLIMLAAVAAPFLVELIPQLRVPVVVLEILFGILIGPHVLGWAGLSPVVEFLGAIGMASLFFHAGLEIDFEEIRGAPLRLAGWGWLMSAAIALAVSAGMTAAGLVHAPLLFALSLTTTALGTLVPILKNDGVVATPFGRFVLAAGAAGELGPILAISLLFSGAGGAGLTTILLLVFAAITLGLAFVALRARPPRIVAALGRSLDKAAQLPVRLCMLLLASFILLTSTFGIDIILGAFAAGMLVSLAVRNLGHHRESLLGRLEAVGFGFVIPIFFIVSGMRFDLPALLDNPRNLFRLPLVLALLFLARGVPVLVLYRREMDRRERTALGLMSATALPLLVAITEIGKDTGRMTSANAATLVGAGMLSVVLFPALALAIRGKRTEAAEHAEHAEER